MGEIRLPPLQAGSSIMPGKVNPVIPEAIIQTGLRVMANDMLIADAASRGTWQINEFLPLIADAFLEEIDLLTAATPLLAAHVRGLAADEARCRAFFDAEPDDRHGPPAAHRLRTGDGADPGISRAATVDGRVRLAGGDAAAARNIRSFLEEKLGKELIDEVLSPYRLTALGYRKHGYDTQGK